MMFAKNNKMITRRKVEIFAAYDGNGDSYAKGPFWDKLFLPRKNWELIHKFMQQYGQIRNRAVPDHLIADFRQRLAKFCNDPDIEEYFEKAYQKMQENNFHAMDR